MAGNDRSTTWTRSTPLTTRTGPTRERSASQTRGRSPLHRLVPNERSNRRGSREPAARSTCRRGLWGDGGACAGAQRVCIPAGGAGARIVGALQEGQQCCLLVIGGAYVVVGKERE
jgi:hypothetical protein